jgi:ectoine hydroxylase-related dioxygenase (phytanoyl-CoA dioxygenase family)
MDVISKLENGPVLTHGVLQKQTILNAFDAQLEEFYRQGFTIIPDVLNPAQLVECREKIISIYKQQIEEIGGDEGSLAKIKDKNIVRSMMAYDDFFLFDIALNEKIRPLIDSILGKYYCMSSQVATINSPGEKLYQLAWHRELQYQHFTSSQPLSIQTLYCIDDFNAQTGGTFVLPYSHLFSNFPSDSFVKKHQEQVVAPAGSVVLLNSMIYHRAGHNTSNKIRRIITNMYTSPIIAQQINISKMMNGRFKDDDFLSKFLGYVWAPANSPKEWREQHLKRNEGL